MYLKSLELKGFKSFADKTTLLFEPGLTCIVGSNGSGKSNISDAILWVLGEQSAKQLRGQSMEDVIFAGSQERKPVSVAEVNLVLDNADQKLPIDFNEVAITRRMYRTGESEYLVNDSPMRLRDIQEILYDTGLGKDTHSIISQGSLDQILLNKPEDRRILVEEAAGISKHKKRRERSIKKLDAMDNSIKRARSNERQLKKRLTPLEKQVDKVKQYDALSEELNELQIDLAVDDLRKLKAQYDKFSSDARECSMELEVAKLEQQKRRDELEKLQVLLEEKGLFVGDLTEQRRRMQFMMERMEANMRLLEEKGRNLVDRLSSTRSTLHQAQKTKGNASKSLEKYELDLQNVKGKLSVLEENFEHIQKEVNAHKASLQDIRSKSDEKNATLKTIRRSLEKDRAELSKALITLRDFKSQDALYHDRLDRLQEDIEEQTAGLNRNKKNLVQEQEILKTIKNKKKELLVTLQEIKKSLNSKKSELEKTRQNLNQASARRDALFNLSHELEKENKLFQNITSKLIDKKTNNVQVKDILRAPVELESLIEVLLSRDLEGLIVPNGDIEGILDVYENDTSTKGAVTLLSNTAHSRSKNKIHAHLLIDELEIKDEYTSIIESLLGDIYLFDTSQEAWQFVQNKDGVKALSRDGIFASSDGWVKLGLLSEDTRELGTLARVREYKKLSKDIPSFEKQKLELEKKVENEEEHLKSIEEKISDFSSDSNNKEYQVGALQREIGSIEASLSRMQDECEHVKAKRAEQANKAKEAEPIVHELEDQIERKEKDQQRLEEEIDDIEASKAEIQSLSAKTEEKLTNAKIELSSLTEQKVYLQERIETYTRELQESSSQIKTLYEVANILEIKSLRVEPLHSRFGALAEEAKSWALRLRDQASLEESGSDTLKNSINEAKNNLSVAHKKVSDAQERVNNMRVKTGKLDVQVEAAVKAIVQTGVVLEHALKRPEIEDREKTEQRLKELEHSIEHIGPINQVALQEYKDVKEHYEYIKSQLDDLVQARKSINKIINTIDKKMRNRFLETFDEVNANFSEMFKAFFPGGNAYLEMTTPDDPANTGIEVSAQPQGKKLSKMMLLSGGEKSLTALALLFAVYKTRTVPFYVLDEVEAALDDTNLNRLLRAVSVLREKTQLIMITHQRRTMEQADVLYGVSMQQNGVSEVVSQKLHQDDNFSSYVD